MVVERSSIILYDSQWLLVHFFHSEISPRKKPVHNFSYFAK